MNTPADFSALADSRHRVRHHQVGAQFTDAELRVIRRAVDEIVRLATLRGGTLTA